MGLAALSCAVGVGGAVAMSAPAQAAAGQAAVVDQRSGVKIFSLGSSSWKGSPLWSWNAPRTAAWKNVSDVKFRTYGGRKVVLVTASGGRAAIIDYSTKKTRWTASPGGNPHAIELLPNGAVVVASSSGKLTAYGKGKSSGRSYSFPSAHAVLWEPGTKRLWALGGTKLCSYKVGGSATSPTLTGKACRTTPSGGHDLSPVYGASAQLWLSTTSHVYTYNINRGTLSRASGYIDNSRIKSVGNHAGGLVVTTRVTKANSDGTWGTGNVWLYKLNGSYVGNRYRPGAAIYKARPVVWSYR
ncbi:DUF6528 family protein [Micromonospora eburnea]|uniref:DUF6528 family protein n=1 Tax=Micromonospora eburnea TaxID=227316 RepID=UPI000B80DCEA|nr:DUF6528 family protein [Micromonospora eburnea]